MAKIPFFVSIPHSGEKIPPETPWLKGLPETLLMCDVDRFVDQLYVPNLESLEIPFVKTQWHRFAVDLNRLPEDIDADSVEGASHPSGSFPRGFHWTLTTLREKLMPHPMSQETHRKLVKDIYESFHQNIRDCYESFKNSERIFHLDAHSMPSRGTSEHRDPGQERAEIVVSDCKGKSCDPRYKDIVIAAYQGAGFKTAYNWPYFGGRVTEQYGHPEKGHHALQVELNRSLYMDESTKQLRPEAAAKVTVQIRKALSEILSQLANF